MTSEITLQLYSLRNELAKDLPGTLDAIRDIGFKNVETAGLHGLSPSQFKNELDQRGMQAPVAHSLLPIGDSANEVIETAKALGVRYLVTGIPPGGRDNFGSIDQVKAMAELYCQAAEVAEKHGLMVGYHNHHFDLVEVEGKRIHKIFLENTPQSVLWEADVFWISEAGLNPVEFIQEIGPRGRILHLKDGAIQNPSIDPPFLPCGEGDVDLIAAAQAAQYAEYSAVELDAYSGDMIQAVEKSYQYLTQKGLAR